MEVGKNKLRSVYFALLQCSDTGVNRQSPAFSVVGNPQSRQWRDGLTSHQLSHASETKIALGVRFQFSSVKPCLPAVLSALALAKAEALREGWCDVPSVHLRVVTHLPRPDEKFLVTGIKRNLTSWEGEGQNTFSSFCVLVPE